MSDATYTSTATGNTFVFVSKKDTQTNAEKDCLSKGGHLAAFMSDKEQDEVESYYVTKVRSGACRAWCLAAQLPSCRCRCAAHAARAGG
jgi:hypothetical protein